MKKNPKVGIIVLSYNSEDYIERCLKSIISQRYSNVLLYVVDNASQDRTIEKISQFSSIKLIKSDTNTGYAGGNNIGMRKALKDGCDAVFLLNDDAYIEESTIELLVTFAEQSEHLGAVQPLLLLHQDKRSINSCGNSLHYLGFGYAIGYKQRVTDGSFFKTDIAVATGASVLFTREALVDVGLFDQTFFLYHEDIDLSWRMRLRGWSIALAPEARAYHDYSFSKSIQKYYYMERNRILFLLKNFSLRYLVFIAPMFFITELGLSLYSLKNGFAKERMQAWSYLMKRSNRKELMLSRRVIQKSRKVKDRELLGYLTDEITAQEIDSSLLNRIGNPLFRVYFKLIKPLI